MTTYAIAPKGCSYFTAGKAYEVLNDNEYGFNVVSEMGREEYTIWEGSAHFSGNAYPWEPLDRAEAQARNALSHARPAAPAALGQGEG